MPDSLAQARDDVALANRILANEGIFDAFGHVSLRHPADPERFLISRHRAPELVQQADILELDLDGKPAVPTPHRLYGEVTIHASIFQARPDVTAICHHHAPAMLPYAIARVDMVPVYHLGASMGGKVPFWDSRDEFGDTALVVVDPAEGKSLARALGAHWLVQGRHGATVVATSLRELVFRTIYTARNAELQTQARLLGGAHGLSDEEIRKAAAYNLRPAPMERAWDLWAMRLAIKEGRAAPAAAAGAPAPRKARAATGPAKAPARKAPVRKAPVRKAPIRKAAAKTRRGSRRAR
jgi:ribulose-5-phosphate 4-epimerase/fuculose-1-phosphate aldolase